MKFKFFLERLIFFAYRKTSLIFNIFNFAIFQSYSYKTKHKIELVNFLKKDNFVSKIETIEKNQVKNYLLHNFNLLGSGLKNLNLKKKININFQNQFVSRKISQNIEDKKYKCIDWQKDFKSNYRWNEKKLSKIIKFLNIKNTDVKNPWELARMQHLPQLAIYACKIKKKDYLKAKKIFTEFKNQFLDFVSYNPPNYGVNWICTMDVSIRISNLLIAKDIFNASGFFFSQTMEQIFINTLYDHKSFILKNLEYSSYRNNHYLSNICGLAVIARYLPQSALSDSLIAFVAQELNKEIYFQFNQDGSSIEGSTCYHKFSMEMLFYSTAIIISFGSKRLLKIRKTINSKYLKMSILSPRLKENLFILHRIDKDISPNNFLCPFPKKYFKRLLKINDFFLNTVINEKQIIQIGDNDSGKFFNFTPVFYNQELNNVNKKNYFENRESTTYITDILRAFGLNYNPSSKNKNTFEYIFIKSLLKKIKLKKSFINAPHVIKNEDLKKKIKEFYKLKNNYIKEKNLFQKHYTFRLKLNKKDYIKLIKYENFGIYIWKSKNFLLSLRAVKKYDKKFTSHNHFDQLSNILILDKKINIIDPGTYCYSGNKKYRNYFRGYDAHFSPIKGIKINNNEIFSKIDYPPVKILLINKYSYFIEAKLENHVYYSGYIIENDSINIFHLSDKKIFKNDLRVNYSPGYGLISKL